MAWSPRRPARAWLLTPGASSVRAHYQQGKRDYAEYRDGTCCPEGFPTIHISARLMRAASRHGIIAFEYTAPP